MAKTESFHVREFVNEEWFYDFLPGTTYDKGNDLENQNLEELNFKEMDSKVTFKSCDKVHSTIDSTK